MTELRNMPGMVGRYAQENTENLEGYFEVLGYPYLARKMISVNSPTLEISVDNEGVWTISTSSSLKRKTLKFKLGEEYEERLITKDIVLYNVTNLSDGKLITVSKVFNEVLLIRIFEFDEKGVTLTMSHAGGQTAKRYFKRI